MISLSSSQLGKDERELNAETGGLIENSLRRKKKRRAEKSGDVVDGITSSSAEAVPHGGRVKVHVRGVHGVDGIAIELKEIF